MSGIAMVCLGAAALAVLIASELAARPGRDLLARRLQRYVVRRAVGPRRRASAFRWLDRRLARVGAAAAVDRRLHEAGVALGAPEALLGAAAGTAGAGIIAAVSAGLAAGVAAAAVCLAGGWWWLGVARDLRCRRLERQLPAALDLMIGELRAHRSPAHAMAEIARRLSDPLRTECAHVAEDLALGASLAQGLNALRRRIPSRALDAVVTATLVAEQSGGNLAECLARQSDAIREQLAFLHEVRAITVHARGTATVLSVLPAGVAAAMLLLDPNAMAPLLDTHAGRALLAVAAALQAGGWYAMRAMIRGVTG